MRKIADCRRFESESNCSLTIIGEEEEVVTAAAEHAASVHGHEDTPQLREQIRSLLEPEESYMAGRREPEPFPG
jgi:predicted small metal-binding protein